MQIQPLAGKVAIVTGASKGIGAAITRALAAPCYLRASGRSAFETITSEKSMSVSAGTLAHSLFQQFCYLLHPHAFA